MTCCCSLRVLYKVHAIEFDLHPQLNKFTIRVDQVNFMHEKFGFSAYSQDRLVAEQVR